MKNELETCVDDLGFLLSHMQLKLVTAESCTGGLIAQALTAIPGCSNWFERGFITYSNDSKKELLHVSATTLDEYGSVSEQTANQMVVGALRHSKADLALAVTGIAGPEGGTPDKPVGFVCFGWLGKTFPVETHQQIFKGNRQQIRERAAIFALSYLIEILRKL